MGGPGSGRRKKTPEQLGNEQDLMEDLKRQAREEAEAEIKQEAAARELGSTPDQMAQMFHAAVRAMLQEQKAQDTTGMVLKHKPWEGGEYPTEEEYDIFARATELARANGHRVERFFENSECKCWEARCLDCGFAVITRWQPAPANDPDPPMRRCIPEVSGWLVQKKCFELRRESPRQFHASREVRA